MQTNLWNIKNSKERLGIRERTEAHKRHLISLVKAKSILDDKNKEWKIKSLNADLNRRRSTAILIQNKILAAITKSQLKESASWRGPKVQE